MQAPPAAESGPITMFTQEQLAALSAYFGISLRTPASAEQTKIVPGAAKNGIQVTAASVLSYADTKGTERAGNITARLSGTYDGRQFQNVQAVFTGFEDVYGSNVRKNRGTLKLNAKSLLAQSKSIDEFIAAAKASPATYLDTFTFILENGTNINALDMGIRSYTVENILFEKTDDAVPSVKVSAQYKVHYFSRERDKDERAETVDKDSFIMKIAYAAENPKSGDETPPAAPEIVPGAESPAAPEIVLPAAPGTEPITAFTQEQLAALSVYFGIAVRTPASAEQTKIVPGAAKNGIQVTAATVLSYADAKGTERAGSITARLSGTYDGRPFESVQAVFTGFKDAYGSNVQSKNAFKLDFTSAIKNAQSIDDYIAAANARIKDYVQEFSFGLYNGTQIDALAIGNRSYSVENMRLTKSADTIPQIKISAQYSVHYFSREQGEAEVKETVSKDFVYYDIKTEFYAKKDVFNYIIEDADLLLPDSSLYSDKYASELYARHTFDKQAVWDLMFSSETIDKYRSLYPAYKTIIVAIRDLGANDITGELHVTYYIAAKEDIDAENYTDVSAAKTRTFTGFKKIDKTALEKNLLPVVLPADFDSTKKLFAYYDAKFKKGLENGTYTDADATYDLGTKDRSAPYPVLREINQGLQIGDGGGTKDGFSNNTRKITFRGKSVFETFSSNPPFLTNGEQYISYVQVRPVSVTVNPTVKARNRKDYLYLYNYEVSFDIPAAQSPGSSETATITLDTAMRSDW
ncbi:hypothetical protein [Treponema brennaborense]|nr:hypothetical protein [Treponema brennaborense]